MRAPEAVIALLLFAASVVAPAARSPVQVYPSGPTVPENLLRIELRFSTPLRPPLSIEHVKLTNVDGVEISGAFLDLLLPSRDGKRVTILMHPGRVKSGVGANLNLGRALRAGDTVVLVINHPALAKSIRKAWQVTAFDAESPQPANWTFKLPRRGSRIPILLRLDAPISSSAEGLIAIRGPDGRRLAGDALLESGETVWRFVPARPWLAGSYAVVTHPDLEDSAGNRPSAPFEVSDASQVRREEGTVQPFELFK
ncbi:hypothetical protein [Pedosphaera parvula]|uniref:SbsA Ig-like domain-containing protein n=1 Tax=Pedosphaera parvula (strain Ellin514) TaxID=320771 RepID=B9XAH9_PEDPL|nr:hypothetical protein [Pedosphaera parvula]EEF63014.1 conserved hypothetical protein [Pedosphaera parvula Ellin514]